MTTTAPAPQTHTPQERPVRPPTAWRSSVLAPLAAGLATLCSAMSLTGVVTGEAWLGYVFVAIVLVACTGLALRSLRAPTIVAGLAQLLVLLFLIVGSFTTTGILKIIPGPAAFAELRDVMAAAAEQIRTGLPPVDATPPILCLVTMAIGLVAILVDTLAVAASAPAATGLVLLCVYAIPASLSDELLPWWTFLLGAGAFAGLLAVDGNHRHRRWRTRDAPGLGPSPGSTSTPIAVVSVALVLGLITGVAVTGVGTVGSLPGGNGPGKAAGSGGFGVEPFTQLRGLLDQGADVELFKVRGLGTERHLLRAFTLDTYFPNQGWGIGNGGRMPPGVLADRTLPAAPGDDGRGESKQIQIEPTNWVDYWLPVFGAPRGLRGIGDNWQYDKTTGAVFTTTKENSAPYTETASLREPTKTELREADPKPDQIPVVYSTPDRIDPRVIQKAQQITETKSTNFDKATALWQFFTAPNGFVYDAKTAEAADADALADFVLKGKRGFCEQFASAMGVMLRAIGIPARVAIGFTPGVPVADHQVITSKDAHAWVEVYFGDQGWVSFDPTPLADGRGYIPSYLQADGVSNGTNAPDDEKPSKENSPAPSAGTPTKSEADPTAGQAQQTLGDSGWQGVAAGLLGLLAVAITVVVFLLSRRSSSSKKSVADKRKPAVNPSVANWLPLVAVTLWVAAIAFLAAWASPWFALVLLVIMTAVGAPSVIREITRRRRLQAITTRSPDAADAAWRELMDECADRGVPIPNSDTVRVAGQKLAQRHHLDEDGRNGLRTVIGVVEKSWYRAEDENDPALAAAFEDLRQSLHRNAPMSWRGRLFPQSLLRRRKS